MASHTVRLLSEDNCGGTLTLSPTAKDKHPKWRPPLPITLIGESSNSTLLPHQLFLKNLMVLVSVVLLLKLEVQLDLLGLMLQYSAKCVLHSNVFLMISVKP